VPFDLTDAGTNLTTDALADAEGAGPPELEPDVAPDAPEDEVELLLLPHPTTAKAHSTHSAATNRLRIPLLRVELPKDQAG
jgi:hypothetical protein